MSRSRSLIGPRAVDGSTGRPRCVISSLPAATKRRAASRVRSICSRQFSGLTLRAASDGQIVLPRPRVRNSSTIVLSSFSSIAWGRRTRHFALQYRMLSQLRSHFLRHVMRRPQRAQILSSRPIPLHRKSRSCSGRGCPSICRIRDPWCCGMLPDRKKPRTLPLFAQAMTRQSIADDLQRVENRPSVLKSGVRGLDRGLGGGFRVGELTVLALPADAAAWRVVAMAVLTNARRASSVALLSERQAAETLQRDLVAVEAGVDLNRVRAGLVSAEDRLILGPARKRIPWSQILTRGGTHNLAHEADELIFSYRPILVMAEVMPRALAARSPHAANSRLEGTARLASLARRHRVSIVVVHTLPASVGDPGLSRLPGWMLSSQVSALALLHEGATKLRIDVVRLDGATLAKPREITVRKQKGMTARSGS